MSDQFFSQPILNSPYVYPARHWELDQGQPTGQVIEARRSAEFITPIPKPKKQKGAAGYQQQLLLGDSAGISTARQQYDPTPVINEIRRRVDAWRQIPNPSEWRVTPDTARLLQHWRAYGFHSVRPFFCQVEAVETTVWLTEVAPDSGKDGSQFLDYLTRANG